ncbi:TPA: ATP-binding protein, partial [Streptococcus agalactiae]|nr:ATP-binding protein [Streptococcus agalactiae]
MLDILSEKHLERRQRIIISAIAIALAAQINISILADGFIMTLSLFILPVFLYFNDDINPILLCLGITFASPIFRGIILSIAG